MKKILIAVLIISIFLVFQSQGISKPYQPQVKGGYKSFTATDYRYKAGKLDMKSRTKTFTVNFDDKGNQIELISYEENKISQINKIANKYNAKGVLIESVYFDEAGKPFTKFTFGYDGKLNRIGDTTYNSSGEATQRSSYKYDENNFMIEETHEFKVDSVNFVKGTTYYKNDKYGNKIEEIANHTSNISVQVTSEVNLENKESKNEIKTNEAPGAAESVTYDYKYDDKGNIIREVRNGIGGTKLITEYKYDKFGNIIEQIGFDENDKPALKTVFDYAN